MGLGPVGLLEIAGLVLLATLLGVGGGNGFVPLIQSHWVSPGYIDPGMFAWVIALGQLTPGPKVGFVAGIAYYLRGIPGSVVAVVATALPTAFSSMAVSIGMDRLRPLIQRIGVPGLFVVAGLMMAAGWDMVIPIHPGVLEVGAIALITYLTGWREVDPVWVVLGAVAVGLVWRAVVVP